VSRLRGKLEEEPSKPKLIKTLQGIGYLLDYEGHFAANDGEAVTANRD